MKTHAVIIACILSIDTSAGLTVVQDRDRLDSGLTVNQCDLAKLGCGG